MLKTRQPDASSQPLAAYHPRVNRRYLAYVAGHVFISYSHTEAADYVERLGEHLGAAGIAVWYDKEIITGDRWRQVIREKIDTCAALIIVMTPGAEQSAWVDREIVLAENLAKPILPLLLKGPVFFGLGDLQYENVATGALPSAAFTSRLRRLLPADRADRRPLDDPVELTRRHDQARAVGDAGDSSKAVRLLRDLVNDRARVLGADHPDTLASRHWLAYYVGESRDRAKAARLFRDLVNDRTRVLGADHPDTLASRHWLAYYVGYSGDRAKAARLFRDLVNDRTRVLGADHPDTLASQMWLVANAS